MMRRMTSTWSVLRTSAALRLIVVAGVLAAMWVLLGLVIAQ